MGTPRGRPGKTRIKLSEMIFDTLGIDVRPEELHVITNGGSMVYDPPRWEGFGIRVSDRQELRLFSWNRMADLVKHGIRAGELDGAELEITVKEPEGGKP